MRISMLLSNPFRPDQRVEKEAKSLSHAGHAVTIVCWDRRQQFEPLSESSGFRVERIQDVPTVYGAGAKQLLHTPRFWRSAVRRVRAQPPDVVHCHDLDTLPAGWWIKRTTGCRLVYDAHEDYPAMMSLYLPGLMNTALSWLERLLLRNVDHTITASTVLADKLRARGIDHVTTIGNFHNLSSYDQISSSDIQSLRARLGISQNDLVVTYIGGFSLNRQLLPLIEAADGMDGVQAFIWGDGHQRQAVEQAAANSDNVRYAGWLASEFVPLHTQMSDVIYYCLREDYPGAAYNAPNTLGHAMAAGRPILANEVGDLGRIVRQTGCGLLLKSVTPTEIRAALETLRDPNLRQQMGKAGRQAAETEYNEAHGDKLLRDIYHRLER
jgi:glycosyltransferase involved in cell wall biosynthesis